MSKLTALFLEPDSDHDLAGDVLNSIDAPDRDKWSDRFEVWTTDGRAVLGDLIDFDASTHQLTVAFTITAEVPEQHARPEIDAYRRILMWRTRSQLRWWIGRGIAPRDSYWGMVNLSAEELSFTAPVLLEGASNVVQYANRRGQQIQLTLNPTAFSMSVRDLVTGSIWSASP